MILDSDYRSPNANREIVDRLSRLGITAHIWNRKELESYLLEPDVIARVSGADPEVVESLLLDLAELAKALILNRRVYELQREERSAERHPVSIADAYSAEFETEWRDPVFRVSRAPAKDLLSDLNTKLQAAGFKAVSARALSREMGADELDAEVVGLLKQIEGEAVS